MAESRVSDEQVLTFGSFRLYLPGRVLQEGERPVRLGSRSLEILLVLVERAGELVGTNQIIA